MDDIDKELMPVLARLVLLVPYNNNHTDDPDVVWFYNWLIHPHRTVEEFYYVVVELQSYVLQNLVRRTRESFFDPNDDGSMDEFQNAIGLPQGDIVYLIDHMYFGNTNRRAFIIRTAAEALAARCPVLEGRWRDIARSIFSFLGDNKWVKNYGYASRLLNKWIFHVVGNPEVCPDVDLRYQILLLYKTMVKIDHGNYKQALVSFMSFCCFLEKPRQNFNTIEKNEFEKSISFYKTRNIIECLMVFKKEELGERDIYFECHWVKGDPHKGFLYKFNLKIAKQLKSYRCRRQHIHIHDTTHDYSMGIKTITEPRELLSLTQLIRNISNVAHLEYLAFKDRGQYDIEKLKVASCGMVNIVRCFQGALSDPMLLSIAAESIIDVMEAVLIILNHAQGGIGWPGSHALVNVDVLLEELFDCEDDGDIDARPIGWAIIKMSSSRIRHIRSQISEFFLKGVDVASMIYAILYNTEL